MSEFILMAGYSYDEFRYLHDTAPDDINYEYADSPAELTCLSYTKQAEDIRESVRVLKEKLTEVLENRSERNRWISQFTQFSTLETLDRRALIHMVQSIRVRGKKELDITFTHEDEYKKALQLLALAAQQKDYEQRKVG